MAIKLKFDQNYNVTSPTFVLATKSGDKLGAIPAENIVVKTSMNDADELSFTIHKSTDDIETLLWDEITDFKLLWCRDWDLWFEIYVEVDETSETVKNITAVSLGEAELSQIYLYDIEINTEDDIARDDYIPTVLYNESNSKASLLNRILEKAPHYTVHHVDVSIQNIQRTFSFDGETIYDAFQDIAEEINCIFVINCSTASDGKIQREIDVYDLESYCLDCGHRDEFLSSCPECGSQNIMTGYGTDTTIFVSTQNLSEEIQYSVDTDSVKNCFRLKAGDDLMTATVRNCNPNGSGYIWYISDELKKDMSDELVSRLNAYDSQYNYYNTEYQTALDLELTSKYNNLVKKYSGYSNMIVTSTDEQGGIFNNTGYKDGQLLIYSDFPADPPTQSGTCGENISWYLYPDGLFKLSGSGQMDRYSGTASNVPWYVYRHDIKKIVIDKEITNLSVYSFYGATNCTEIIFENGSQITDIGGSSIYYLSSLTEIILPEGVTTIGNYAFGYCSKLSSVYVPDGVTSINDTAFNNCNLDILVLNVASGSYAENYAKTKNIKYIARDPGVGYQGTRQDIPMFVKLVSKPDYTTTGFIPFVVEKMVRIEGGTWDSNSVIFCYNSLKEFLLQITYDDLLNGSKYGNVIYSNDSITWYSTYSDYLKDVSFIRVSCKCSGQDLFISNRKDYYKFSQIPDVIVGYSKLATYYYDTIDFYLFLQNNMMPEVTVEKTTAIKELGKLSGDTLSPVGVMNLDRASEATVSNAVLAMAKILVNSTYRVQTTNESLSSVSTVDTGDGQKYQTATWSGQFIITSYSDEEDTATSGTIQVRITNQYEEYVKQKIDKELNKKSDEATDIVALFNLDDDDFKEELTKYCLSRLTSFHDACQACLDILIEQGIADRETWANSVPDMYNEVYIPYYNKLGYIQDEINVRESEIETITGKYDSENRLLESGVQTALEDARIEIQNALNFENYIGEDLWKEFSAYRREDEYTNENYVSDGLNNTELFQKAKQFISVAEKEIYKSAVLQHVVSANLKSFLTMEEFAPIVDYFETGNWIRVQANDVIYRLRLLEYQVQFGERGEVSSIDVEFSDVRKTATGMSDIESVLDEASSMATSYDSVARQADDGAKGNEKLQNWVTKGLALTQMKIIDNADYQNITFDSHGLLCKEFNPMTEEYDDKQLKIINRGLYLTDDNWLTSRAGIGDFAFYNPMTKQMEESYGVIADTLVGNLILSEKVGVYNTNNGIVMDEFGLTITTHSDSIDDEVSGDTSLGAFTIQNEYTAADGSTQTEKLFYIDSDGNVVLNGNIRINTPVNINVDDEEEENPENTDYIITINDLCDPTRITNAVDSKFGELQTQFETSIDKAYADAMAYADQILNGYKADVGQYMQYGLDGLTLGAVSSPFKTLIDNQGMYFKQDDSIVSYVNNHQLYIPNAVIESTLTIGNFFFSPYPDGSVSLTWQN